MESLVHTILSNALVATGLAIVPLCVRRLVHSPALVHTLWLLVLLKLITPPVVSMPLAIAAVAPEVPQFQATPSHSAQGRFRSRDPAERTLSVELPAIADHHDETLLRRDSSSEPVLTATSAKANWPESEGSHFADTSRRSGWLASLGFFSPVLRVFPRWHLTFLTITGVGSLSCWILAALRIARLRRLLHDLRQAPPELRERVGKVARRLGLGWVPAVWLAPGRIPPMLWTLGHRACLIVPAEFWPDLEEDQQTALLAHELAHLKRRDHWVRWLDLVVTGLYWWHPVVWLARRGLREAEELCCDAWAVWAVPQGSRRYASALLAALEFVSGASTAGVAAAAAVVSGRRHISYLKGRMQMIVQAKTPRSLSTASRLAMLGMALLILPLAPTWAQNPDSAHSEADRDSTNPTVRPDGRENRSDWKDDLDATGARNFDVEMSLDDLTRQLGLKDRSEAEKLREKINKDPEVAPLIDQIKQLREQMQNFRMFARHADDPAYVAANEQLQIAEREYLKLWENKSHAEAERLKAQTKDRDDDEDKEADDRMEATDHLERLLKDLGEKLSKDIGPLGGEISKALDKAAKEVSEAIEKEGILSKGLRDALERARDELHDAFKEGGSFNQEAREAFEKARKDMSESVEKARQELREVVRKRAEEAKKAAQERLRSQTKEKDEEAGQEPGSVEKSNEVEQARQEVRQIEQQLRRAIRKLEAIERHEQRVSRGLRHGSAATPGVPPKPPEPADGPEGRPAPPPAPSEAPVPLAGLRPFRRPEGAPGAMRGPAPPVANPRVERRLRDLEDKMDRLLKELESLKGNKTGKPSGEKDED